MAWTRHGKQISLTPVEPMPPEMKVTNCQGPGACKICSSDETAFFKKRTKTKRR